MLQGAIIGLVVGLMMVVIRAVQQKKGGGKVLAALREGGPNARAALDGYVAPASGKVPMRRLLELMERYSWLAIIGDYDTLEHEAAGIDGNLSVVCQLRAQAAVGLLAHRTDPRDLEALRAVAQRIETEGGAMMGLVKGQLRDLATVAGGLQQMPIDLALLGKVHNRARQSGKGAKIVLLRFLARCAEAASIDPTEFRREAELAMSELQGS